MGVNLCIPIIFALCPPRPCVRPLLFAFCSKFVFVFRRIQWGLYFVHLILGVAERARDESRNWMLQVARLFRGRGSAEEWPAVAQTSGSSSAGAQILGVSPTPPSLPGLRDPGLYLGFFSRTSDFAIPPRKSLHPPGITAGIGDEGREWDWLDDQARAGAPDPE